jgi:hypothetical protein
MVAPTAMPMTNIPKYPAVWLLSTVVAVAFVCVT